MTPVSAPALASGSLAQSHGSERERLSAAARQFEAIFLRQMLAAARKADFGAPLLGGQGLETFRTMQEEHFADLASKSGAFGLAAQIEAQLARHLTPLPPAGGAGGGPVSDGLKSPPLTPPASGRGTAAFAASRVGEI